MECLARVLIIEGKPSDAVAWMEKAVKTNAQSAEHHLWLANALREAVQNVSALRRPFLAPRMREEYERAVALDPALLEARHWLAMFYSNAPALFGGGMEKAREQAEAIAKVDLVRGQTDLAQIAERETNYAGAVAIYESLIKAWAAYH